MAKIACVNWGNKGVGDHSCGDAKTKCKKTKYIEVTCNPESVEALAGIGFKAMN